MSGSDTGLTRMQRELVVSVMCMVSANDELEQKLSQMTQAIEQAWLRRLTSTIEDSMLDNTEFEIDSEASVSVGSATMQFRILYYA